MIHPAPGLHEGDDSLGPGHPLLSLPVQRGQLQEGLGEVRVLLVRGGHHPGPQTPVVLHSGPVGAVHVPTDQVGHGADHLGADVAGDGVVPDTGAPVHGDGVGGGVPEPGQQGTVLHGLVEEHEDVGARALEHGPGVPGGGHGSGNLLQGKMEVEQLLRWTVAHSRLPTCRQTGELG